MRLAIAVVWATAIYASGCSDDVCSKSFAKCTYGAQPPQSDTDACHNATGDCATKTKAYFQCMQDNQTCTPDGHLDRDATQAACASQGFDVALCGVDVTHGGGYDGAGYGIGGGDDGGGAAGDGACDTMPGDLACSGFVRSVCKPLTGCCAIDSCCQAHEGGSCVSGCTNGSDIDFCNADLSACRQTMTAHFGWDCTLPKFAQKAVCASLVEQCAQDMPTRASDCKDLEANPATSAQLSASCKALVSQLQ